MPVGERSQGLPGIGAAGSPHMRLVGNAELDQRERADDERRSAAAETFTDRLSGHLSKLWERARQAKERVQREMLEDYRARAGEYDPEKLQEIRSFAGGTGSEIYMMMTNQKCRAAEAWLRDVLVPADEDCWGVEPTPLPEMPPEAFAEQVERVVQEAAQAFVQMGVEPTREMMAARVAERRDDIRAATERAARERAQAMQDKISDQLAEGGWREALEAFLNDFTTTKAGILKGPVIRRRRQLKWARGESGRSEPQVAETYRYEYERVSPLDIYPAPDAISIQDSYLFERHFLWVEDLQAMRGLAGVDAAKLDRVIERYAGSGLHAWEHGDTERSRTEQKPYARWPGYSDTIETHEFWGPVLGSVLAEWGIPGELDPHKPYAVNAWRTGEIVWKATLNEHPLGQKPYAKSAFDKIAGGFWGRGPAEILRDTQQLCNACARTLVNNMGQASGPQVVINDTDRIQPETDVEVLYPWKTWQFAADDLATSAHRPPIEFFQPNPMTKELLEVYDYFSQLADRYLGMPSYPFSEMDGAASDTASGMSMALSAASKQAKRVIGNIDVDVTEPTVERQWLANMLYERDESIKGDVRIRARGSAALIEREQARVRRQEFLAQTLNDVDMSIIGADGRAAVLRESAKALDMPLPDLNLDKRSVDERMRQRLAAAQQQHQQAAAQQGERQGQQRTLRPDGAPAGGGDANAMGG